MLLKVKTWQIEIFVVSAILLIINTITHKLFSIEIIAALAVILTFGHAQIADRLSEQESLRDRPIVECYHKMLYYFIGKELLWFMYFLLNHSYSALIGVIVFLFYPLWRKLYRKYKNDNCH